MLRKMGKYAVWFLVWIQGGQGVKEYQYEGWHHLEGGHLILLVNEESLKVGEKCTNQWISIHLIKQGKWWLICSRFWTKCSPWDKHGRSGAGKQIVNPYCWMESSWKSCWRRRINEGGMSRGVNHGCFWWAYFYLAARYWATDNAKKLHLGLTNIQ